MLPTVMINAPKPLRARLCRRRPMLRDTSAPVVIDGEVVLHPLALSNAEKLQFQEMVTGYLILNSSFERWKSDADSVEKTFVRDASGRYVAAKALDVECTTPWAGWLLRMTSSLDEELGRMLADAHASAMVLMQRTILTVDENSPLANMMQQRLYSVDIVAFMVPTEAGFAAWFENSISESGVPRDAAIAAFDGAHQLGRLVDWIRYWMRGAQARVCSLVVKEVRAAVAQHTIDFVIEA